MADTTKTLSQYDQDQILKKVYNKEEGTLAVGSFVAGKLGHKIERNVVSAVIDDWSYYDNGNLLYTVRVTYSNSAHDEVNSVERIA